jgi:hypothetical protein
MRMRSAALFAVALLTFGACEIPNAPKWNIDVFFPIRYPDVQLSQYGAAIPPFDVTYTFPVDSQNVSNATRQIFDEEIDSLKADVILANTTNIAGTLTVSIAASRSNLFSSNATLAVTVPILLKVTAGDTTRIPAINTTLFRQATKIYTQTRVTMRSATGAPLGLTANDKLSIGVDLTANVKMSKEGTP